MPHNYLEVINVGQGDCMLLRPQKGCMYAGHTFVIDTGNGQQDISEYLDKDEHFSLILTHSHVDHIGGLGNLLPRLDLIDRIILPYYHNEIVLLAKALKKVLGIEHIPYNSWPIRQLDEYIRQNGILYSIVTSTRGGQNSANELGEQHHPVVTMVRDGDTLCNHLAFLNPPMMSAATNIDYTDRIQNVSKLFANSFADQMEYWLTVRIKGGSIVDAPDLNGSLIPTNGRLSEVECRAKGLFVLNFLEDNHQKIQSFINKPSLTTLNPIVRALDLTANQASLMFRFDTNDFLQRYILFTGDVDVSVFERLIAEGKSDKLRADVLKVPHHGSKTGLNSAILDIIQPRCAIISHGNRRFGKCPDPHPHCETIELLRKHNVIIYVTNEVEKANGITIKKKQSYGVFEIKEY